MKIKKLVFGFLILTLLSCNYVTRMIVPPTATLVPTVTATATLSPTPTTIPLLPAYVPPQCAAVPLATVSPDVAAQATPEIESNKKITKRQQFRVLADLETVIEKFYVYPDYNGKDWEEIKSRYHDKVEAGLDTEAFYVEMQNMITELGDEHSSFLSPLEVKASEEDLKGESQFVGVGISGNFDSTDGHGVVISTFPDSSAEHSGIKMHDRLLLADNLPIVNEQTNRLRGPECSAVVVTVQSPGQEPRQVMLIRHNIEGNLRIDAHLVATADGSKIGYIFIPSFFDEAIPSEIEQALNDFSTLDGLILDVRMNKGGISTVANAVMSFFTSGRLGQLVSRDFAEPLELEADPIQNSQAVPLVVMVSRESASYAEIFAGIMRDSRGAKITGETSLGNVEILDGFNFEDDSKVWLAARTFVPAHTTDNWEDTGIVTDMEAFAEWDSFTFETDPSIAAALTLLGHK